MAEETSPSCSDEYQSLVIRYRCMVSFLADYANQFGFDVASNHNEIT